MCGIMAILNKEKRANVPLLRMLLLDNESRGRDSTGVLCINGTKDIYLKKAEPASEFIHKIPNKEYKLMLGHTRFATIGAVSDRNAHPFKRRGLYLVHNGSVTNHKELAAKSQIKYQVDSEVLLPIVLKDYHGLTEVEGSAAILAYNEKDNTLMAYRDVNPLYRVETPHFWAYSSKETALSFMEAFYTDFELIKIKQGWAVFHDVATGDVINEEHVGMMKAVNYSRNWKSDFWKKKEKDKVKAKVKEDTTEDGPFCEYCAWCQMPISYQQADDSLLRRGVEICQNCEALYSGTNYPVNQLLT